MVNILILGSGLSGMGACKLAIKNNLNVRISDNKKISEKNKNILNKYGVDWEENVHSFSNLEWVDYIVKSPGVPNEIEIVREANSRKIPIISEIEFAYQFIDSSKIIAVTGSNGKTTTSKLIYSILSYAGLDVELCGNSFTSSFSEKLSYKNSKYYVLELSSFQLENIDKFQPHISILLNFSPDHLDRYDFDENKYYNTKMRIQSNQKNNNSFIYFSDDKNITQRLNQFSDAKLFPFGASNSSGKNVAWIDKNQLIINHKNLFTMVLHEMALQGRHNVYNSMAAGIAAKILGVNNDILRQCLSNFKGVEHRLEPVLKLDDKLYINDSKATNCNSVFFALESVKSPVIWVCGGVDKGNDYTILDDLVKEKVDSIIVLGNSFENFRKHFEKIGPKMYNAESMQDAVILSHQISNPGHTILLSPACSSFDMFQDYQERGRIFKECVFNL